MALIEKPSPPQPIPEPIALPSEFPTIPDEVRKRFSSMGTWQDDIDAWYRKVRQQLYDTQDIFQSSTNDTINEAKDFLSASDGALSAAILTEKAARISGDTALATQITLLTAAYQAADVTLQANIGLEATARANADTAEATIRSTADATLSTSIGTVSASVTTEQTARIAADGQIYLKWGVALDINGRIVGRVNLDGTNQSSTFRVSSDFFQVQNAAGTVNLVDVRSAGGVIVFGADLQSDNFAAGSAGWKLTRNGDFEGNTGTFRGVLDIFHGADNEVLIDTNGMSLGDRASSRYIWMRNWASGSSSAIGIDIISTAYTMRYGTGAFVNGMSVTHSAGAEFLAGLAGGAVIQMYPSGGGARTIDVDGDLGQIKITGNYHGPGVNLGYLYNVRIETNPSNPDYCGLGMEISAGSDGFEYGTVDVNGNIRYLRLYPAVP